MIWGNWGFNYDMDWIGKSNSEEVLGGSTVIYRGVTYDAVRYTDDVFYHALSASYDFDMGLRLLVGVANLADEEPPQLTRIGESNEYAPVGNALLASNYDMFGRRFFMNATWNFQ